jgi:hypothetical protein
VAPHSTHLPWSRLQTSSLTAVGITRLRGSWLDPGLGSLRFVGQFTSELEDPPSVHLLGPGIC